MPRLILYNFVKVTFIYCTSCKCKSFNFMSGYQFKTLWLWIQNSPNCVLSNVNKKSSWLRNINLSAINHIFSNKNTIMSSGYTLEFGLLKSQLADYNWVLEWSNIHYRSNVEKFYQLLVGTYSNEKEANNIWLMVDVISFWMNDKLCNLMFINQERKKCLWHTCIIFKKDKTTQLQMHLHLASVISPSLHCCYLRETVHNWKEKKEKLKWYIFLLTQMT